MNCFSLTHKFLKRCKAISNNLSANITFSKTQLSKLGGFTIGRIYIWSTYT